MNGRLFLHLCYKLCDCRQIPTLGGAVKTETQTQCSQIQIHSTVLIPPNRTATVKLAATYSVFQIHSQTDQWSEIGKVLLSAEIRKMSMPYYTVYMIFRFFCPLYKVITVHFKHNCCLFESLCFYWFVNLPGGFGIQRSSSEPIL